LDPIEMLDYMERLHKDAHRAWGEENRR